MSPHDLTPLEARAIVRRHAHDLRNMINCMDLEIACLVEDAPSAGPESAMRKIREQLALTERLVYSLSVRFREPSFHPAAAADIFYNWRQQLNKLGQSARFQWEEPQCAGAVTVDFTAVIAILVEICLQVRTPDGSPPSAAALHTDGACVIYSLKEPVMEHNYPTDVQQWEEWKRLAEISGGRLERTGEDVSPRLTRLIFSSC
jgi:hypothetical protein